MVCEKIPHFLLIYSNLSLNGQLLNFSRIFLLNKLIFPSIISISLQNIHRCCARTPQGHKFDESRQSSGPPGAGLGAGLVPKMPSLFAMGLQQQMLSGGGAAKPGPATGLPPPLTSQLNKQGLQGKQILHLPTLICPNLQKKDF